MAITMNLGTSSHGNGVIFHQNPPFFGDTLLTERSIGAGPPVIIQLSGIFLQMKNRLKISLLITKLSISQHIYVRYVIIRNLSFNLR